MLASFDNETQTALDPENLWPWQAAGLQLDSEGFINNDYAIGSILQSSGACMAWNALTWLLSKIVNYLVAADSPPPGSDDRPWVGINQLTIHERWCELEKQLDAWFVGLPESHKQYATLDQSRVGSTQRCHPEPLCAATMQSYHMAKMLLLLNLPQHSTIGKTTFQKRLQSYRSTVSRVEHHAQDILSISHSCRQTEVQIHSILPLFIAGQCFEQHAERLQVVRLLREIKGDLGCVAENRIRQLMEYW